MKIAALSLAAVFLAPALLAPALLAPAAPAAAPEDPFEWKLPPAFPRPRVPADNPMSRAKVELGRALFFDRRLSASGEMSCATCHRPELAFSDGRPRAVGLHGDLHPRGAPSLFGVAYQASLGWDDPAPASLEKQLLTPLFGHDPIEMGNERSEHLLERLRQDPWLRLRFAAVFPEDAESLTLENLARAIAAFERTLISGGSAYDRWAYGGEPDALSPAARRGLALFYSRRLACGECHERFTLSGRIVHEGGRETEAVFYNTGLTTTPTSGLGRHTLDPNDRGKFRPPTLRNVALTAPYMHDGRFATLGEVIDHYARGGETLPQRDERVRGFSLSEEERQDLLSFLESLTDFTALNDPRFLPP